MASCKKGYYGDFGGRFVPETLIAALQELEDCYLQSLKDKDFVRELEDYRLNYIGRATPLFFAKRLSEHVGGNRKIYLKREDLCHTGAHKINNALGQVMLARRMGKKRVIAETGAGQHGVATATAAALFGLECDVYMGEVDMARQKPNVDRMHLLGARVIPVKSGSRTLKDAINDAFRDWVATVRTTHYVLGTVHGAHPFPMIVRDYQAVIGQEAIKQIRKAEGRLPDLLVASVGGGSNAIGLFHAFRKFKEVEMVGVEAGGEGIASGRHAARFTAGTPGILHGAKTYLLQDKHGQVTETYSVSAGLDYPAVGPEHALMFTEGRVKYTYAKDRDVVNAFNLLSRLEGIIPALESSHALAYTLKRAKKMSNNSLIIVNLSGRGDKDMGIIEDYKQKK